VDQVRCSKCGAIADEFLFHYQEVSPLHKTIIEVGMKCPKCEHKNVGFYLNKKLLRYQKKMQKANEKNPDRYARMQVVYFKKFQKFQQIAREIING